MQRARDARLASTGRIAGMGMVKAIAQDASLELTRQTMAAGIRDARVRYVNRFALDGSACSSVKLVHCQHED